MADHHSRPGAGHGLACPYTKLGMAGLGSDSRVDLCCATVLDQRPEVLSSCRGDSLIALGRSFLLRNTKPVRRNRLGAWQEAVTRVDAADVLMSELPVNVVSLSKLTPLQGRESCPGAHEG